MPVRLKGAGSTYELPEGETTVPESTSVGDQILLSAAAGKWERSAFTATPVPGSVDLFLVSDGTGKYTTATAAGLAAKLSYDELQNTPSLSVVATSGDYDDLINKPEFQSTELKKVYSTNLYIVEDELGTPVGEQASPLDINPNVHNNFKTSITADYILNFTQDPTGIPITVNYDKALGYDLTLRWNDGSSNIDEVLSSATDGSGIFQIVFLDGAWVRLHEHWSSEI